MFRHTNYFRRNADKGKRHISLRQEQTKKTRQEPKKTRQEPKKDRQERKKLLHEHAVQFIIQAYATREVKHKRKYGLTLRAYAKYYNLPYQEFLKYYQTNIDLLEKEARSKIRSTHIIWLEELHREDVSPLTIYLKWAKSSIGTLTREQEDFWITVAEDVRDHGLIKPLFAKYHEEISIPDTLRDIFNDDAFLFDYGRHLDPRLKFSAFSKIEQRLILRTRISSVLSELGIYDPPAISTKVEVKLEKPISDVPYLPDKILITAILNYLREIKQYVQIDEIPFLLFKYKKLKVNEQQLLSILKHLPEIEIDDKKVRVKSDVVLDCANAVKTVKFATLLDGTQPARREWERLTYKAQQSFMHLFNIMCVVGEITNRLQFAKLKIGLYAFKSIRHKLRIICYFHANDIYLLRVFQKKEDHYRPGELETAERVKDEHQLRLKTVGRRVRRFNPVRNIFNL